jgi:hypothetical protein
MLAKPSTSTSPGTDFAGVDSDVDVLVYVDVVGISISKKKACEAHS